MSNAMNASSGKPKSLYRELTVALIALVSLVSVAVSLLNYFYSSRDADAQLEGKISGYTSNLRESLEWPLWNIDEELVGNIGRAVSTNTEISALTIRDDQQRVVYQHVNPDGDQLRREFVITHGGQTIGRVEISFSLHAYEEKNRWLLFSSIGTAALLIVVLLGALRWMLARLLKKPLDALTFAINDVVEGKYRQTALPESCIEFSPILSGINTMSDAVASRENSLRQINEYLAAEIDERKRAEAALRSSEERWQFALEGAGDGVWDWDVKSGQSSFSKRWKAMIGYAEDEFENSFEAWKQHIHPDDLDNILTALQDYFDGKSKDYQVEFRMRCKDHSWKWILARGMLVGRDADDHPLRMIGTHTDISQRKAAEEQLKRYKDHLEEEVQQRTADLVLARNAAETANRAKSVFLSSMSHELRTPLNAILGFSSMMRKDAQLSGEQRENLDIINRSGEHLLTLINDVLEMAKIEAGRVQVENAPFDLGALVRDVTDMMHLRAEEKGLQLLIDQSSEFPRYIKGDEARLRQVLINLVGNAVKFTRQGGITVRFGLKPNTTPHRLLIEVEDSGSGINPADQQRIFEPFVQLGQTTAQKGTGLGLTITRQFVELMGGTINLDSTPDVGSTFRVELPAEKVAAADVSRPNNAIKGEITGIAPGQPEYRILIVEDQLENQLLLSKLMTNIGLHVKIAENGEQGVALFQSWQPHLIWMDRRMPVMDGIKATQRIRELTGGRDVKIVAVTASAFTEQRDEMLKAGMDDFVRKPYRFNEIYECMNKQLGIQYSYASMQAEEEIDGIILTSEMLAVLPQQIRHELHDALESLEEDRISAVIGQVATHDERLHKTLIQLTGNFDYPSILNALNTNKG
jgi:PAS domain S-box-containing protein